MGFQKTFARKGYGTLYKWNVRTGPQSKTKTNTASDTVCTGYVYNQEVIDGQIQRLLYVECGYVQ